MYHSSTGGDYAEVCRLAHLKSSHIVTAFFHTKNQRRDCNGYLLVFVLFVTVSAYRNRAVFWKNAKKCPGSCMTDHIWVAQYASKCTYMGQYGIWQYSSEGCVSGVDGNCDMDECYIDFPSVITKGGFNGYIKEGTSAPEEKNVDELALEMIDGKWGNGTDRKERLTATGYDYTAVQKRVNELLG